MNRSSPIWDNDGPEYEKPEDIESEAERMRRLHNAFAEDMEMLFQAFDRTIQLPRLKQ